MADDSREELQALRRLAELEAKSAVGRSAPGSELLPSYGDMMKQSGLNIGRSFMGGGLGALPGAIGQEALGNATKLLDRGAYQVGGMATDAMAPHVPPEVAAAGGFLGNVGTQAIPALLGAGTGAATEGPLQSMAQRLMKSALNPDAAARARGFGGAPSDADIAARVMLDKGLNASEGGVSRLLEEVPLRKAAITKEIADRTAQGATIERSALARGQPEVEAKFSASLNPAQREASLAEIRGRYLDVLTDPKLPDRIPLAQAQSVKEGQQWLNKALYKKGASTVVDDVVDKDLARMARLLIEEQAPKVGPMNKELSELLTTLKIADKQAALQGKQQVAGIAPAAMNPAAAGVMMLDRNSLLKSALARLLNQTAKSRIPTASGATLGTAIGTESGGLP